MARPLLVNRKVRQCPSLARPAGWGEDGFQRRGEYREGLLGVLAVRGLSTYVVSVSPSFFFQRCDEK